MEHLKHLFNSNLKERIIKDSFWSFISRTINRIGALIFTIILARFLMPEGYGIYSIVFSTAMIFCTFADLGINSTLSRYLSSALVKDRKKIPSYHWYLLKIKFVFSLIISILLLILSYPLSFYVFKNSDLFLPFIIASFYIFVLSFEGFYIEVFYSLEKINYVSFKQSVNQVLRIVLALLVFYFISSSYHIIGIFAALIITSIFVLFLTLFYLKKLIPSLYHKPKEKIDKKRVKRFAGFLIIASISGIFFLYVDSIIIGIFLLPEYVGYYRAAFSLIFGAASFVAFLEPMLIPIFTKLRKIQTQNVLDKLLRYVFIIAIPISFGLLVLGKYFLTFLFGASYFKGALPMMFLSFLILPLVSAGFFSSLFSAKEKPKFLAQLMVSITIINIFLDLLFIKLFLLISPIWAITGVALATLISWIFYFIASTYLIKKKLNLTIPLKLLAKPLIASLIMTGILFYTISFVKNMTLILGISLIIFGALIYLFSMILIKGINKQDLDLIKFSIKKLKRKII